MTLVDHISWRATKIGILTGRYCWSHRSDPRPVLLFASLVNWLQCIWGRSAPSAVLHTTCSLRSVQETCFDCIYYNQLQSPESCSSLARFLFEQRLYLAIWKALKRQVHCKIIIIKKWLPGLTQQSNIFIQRYLAIKFKQV